MERRLWPEIWEIRVKILVSGSEGSLAQIVIPKLQAAGHLVVGVDNFRRHGVVHRQRNYEFVQGDLTDAGLVRELLTGRSFDGVFHLAALVYGVVGFHERPADIIADNSLTTMNLLKYGAAGIGKFIYLSSSMVYERCANVPHREEDADQSCVMSTSYGLSKYIGERVVKSYHEQYGTTYTIWRPFNIITPFESPEKTGYSHVFSDLVKKIVVERQQPLKILGDGLQIRCFTSIHDVSEALASFSLDPRSDNRIFNIGNPEPITVRDLAARIVAITKELGLLPAGYELSFDSQPVYADDVRRRIPDITRIQETFRWQPKISVDESLRAYILHQQGEAAGSSR